MSYIEPQKVNSPRRHFTLVAILDDGRKPENPTGENSVSMSIGRWKNVAGKEEPVLGIRWNGNDLNPIGNPQSRGLPTWFVLPRRLQEMIVDRMEHSPRKRALLQEVFGDDLFAGPDGTGWICDRCGQHIRSAQGGVVEWIVAGEESRWEGRRMFVVHHLTTSPLKNKHPHDGCYVTEEEQQRTNTTVDWASLEEFLGPDGFTQLLSMIANQEIPVPDILETIQRLHLPKYERARTHIPAALEEGLIEPNLARGFYRQHELERVIEKHARRD